MKSICFILLVSFLILVDAKSIHQQNFLEMGDYQGDILLAPWQINGRSGIISPNARWPNNTIPFTFGEEYSVAERAFIRNFMDVIESSTCIRFKLRTTERNYLTIVDEGGCAAYVGNLNIGPQKLYLRIGGGIGSWGCLDQAIIIHELTHTIGFYHMQSAPDRDDYVKIMWENIISGAAHNFDILDEKLYSNFGVPYDYMSLMHYSQWAFSIDHGNKATIKTRDPYYQDLIGQNMVTTKKHTAWDIQRINRMYECDGY